MKLVKSIVAVILVVVIINVVARVYVNRIEKINNGEMVQISESYRD